MGETLKQGRDFVFSDGTQFALLTANLPERILMAGKLGV